MATDLETRIEQMHAELRANPPDMMAKSDQEIRKAALEEWYGILATLWTAIGKPLEKDRLAIYGQDLADVPLGLLEAAVRRVRNEHIYANIPSVGVIRQAVVAELRAADCTSVEDWVMKRFVGFRVTSEEWVSQ